MDLSKIGLWRRTGYLLTVISICFYLLFQPELTQALWNFQYFEVVILLILFVPLSYYIHQTRPVQKWRGLYWPIAVILFAVVLLVFQDVRHGSITQSLIGGLIYFLLFSIVLLLFLSFLALSAHTLGTNLLKHFLGHHDYQSSVPMAVGLAVQLFTLTIVASLGWFKPIPVILVLALPLCLDIKRNLSLLKDTFWTPKKLGISHWTTVWLFLTLALCLAVAWIFSIKPFPQGNDGLTLYMDLSHHLANNGRLATGHQAHAWSVYMAIGETLTNRQVFSVLLSHSIGFLALSALYSFLSRWLSRPMALLAILTVLVTPIFSFHMSVDEKVDLSLLFFSLASLEFCFKHLTDAKNGRFTFLWKEGVILGLMIGSLFAIKYTSVLFIAAFLPILTFRTHVRAQFGMYFVLSAILFAAIGNQIGVLNFDSIELLILTSALILGGVILMRPALPLVRWKRIASISSAIILAAGISFLPWAVKHAGEHESLSIHSLLSGKKETLRLFTHPYYYNKDNQAPEEAMPQKMSSTKHSESAQNLNNQTPGQTRLTPGRKVTENAQMNFDNQEVQRYLGFESGIWKYLSLPWDLTLSINVVGNRYVDIGFIYLFFVLMTLFVFLKRRGRLIMALAGFVWYITFLMSINQYGNTTAQADEVVLINNLIGLQPVPLQGFFSGLSDTMVQIPFKAKALLEALYSFGASLPAWAGILFVFSFSVGFYLFVVHTKTTNQSMSWLASFLLMSGTLWWVLGSGIPWYGLPFFVLSLGGIIYLLQSNTLPKTTRSIGTTVFAGNLLLFLPIFFTNPMVNSYSEPLFKPASIKFMTSPGATGALHYGLTPTYAEIIEEINRDQSARVYSVNSTLLYFIEKSDERVLEDNFLKRYQKSIEEFTNEFDIARCLQYNDYRYVLLNLNMHTLDKSDGNILKTRILNFVQDLYLSPEAELLYTDNLIADERAPMITLASGQKIKARPGVDGPLVKEGSIILFKILMK